MKYNTVDKKSLVEKQTKWVIEQMFSNHKKLRHEEKHFIKNYETLFPWFFKYRYFFYSLTTQTDRQNIYRIVAYIWEECS